MQSCMMAPASAGRRQRPVLRGRMAGQPLCTIRNVHL